MRTKRKEPKQRRMTKREQMVLNTIVALNTLVYTEEEAKTDPNIEYYGYLDQGYGVTYVRVTEINQKSGDVYFNEFEGDLGVFSFKERPWDLIFIGREKNSPYFRLVHVAKINGQAMDLNNAEVTKGSMVVPVIGQVHDLRFNLTV